MRAMWQTNEMSEFYVASSFMYYVYLLENQKDRSWYIGMTQDLEERLKRHNRGDGARTTKRKRDWNVSIPKPISTRKMPSAEKSFSRVGLADDSLRNSLGIIWKIRVICGYFCWGQ